MAPEDFGGSFIDTWLSDYNPSIEKIISVAEQAASVIREVHYRNNIHKSITLQHSSIIPDQVNLNEMNGTLSARNRKEGAEYIIEVRP